MKFREYFLSKIILVSFYCIFAIILAVFLLVASADKFLLIMSESLLIFLMASYIVTTYLLEKRKLNKLNSLVNSLPEKHLLGELLPPPKSVLENEYFTIMKAVSRAAIGEVENAKRDKDEYCQYVESWVHEFKTPLTACSLILDNDADSRKLKRELKRAENLTENILYYARLKSVENDLSLQHFNVREVIDGAIKSQAEIMIASKISIDVDGEFLTVSDSKWLSFILKQLLINCAKYAKGGKVKISAYDNMIIVEDNGIGIPSHELPRITRRGYTGSNGRVLETSTGMGLYIVQGLCNLLNIELSFTSELGKYTKVSLEFPNITKL